MRGCSILASKLTAPVYLPAGELVPIQGDGQYVKLDTLDVAGIVVAHRARSVEFYLLF